MFFHVRVESYGRTDRGLLFSPDSEGNFRVGVMRHAFHLAQNLRAQATRSHVSSRLDCHRPFVLRDVVFFHETGGAA